MKKHMKRAASVLLSSAMMMQAGAAIAAQTTSAEDLQLLYGDLNPDAKLTAADLTLMKRGLMDSSTLDSVQNAVFDLSANGTADIADIVLMSQYLTTQIDNFPSGWLCTIPEDQPDDNPPETQITLADMPAEYVEPMEWIWQNRFVREGSTTRQNTIFDQIVAGKGTLNFVVRWQSYKTVTYEQRQQFEKLASDAVNAWTDHLVGYDAWPYDHVDVKVVGWAVLDKSSLLDLHDDEVVYDNLIEPYDSQWDTSNGYEEIPKLLPSAPSELSRFDHFSDRNYQYPGGLDKRFDMYLWCTQGFPSVGGSGGDWGQRMSDDAYLNMLTGFGIHVLEHEIGHGFGITDFYGANGAIDGPPPAGFPDSGTSIKMAGSSSQIEPFDAWMLRYIWSNIKDEAGRFQY